MAAGSAALAVMLVACKSTRAPALPPDPGSQLQLEAPIERWQDALPLGNGELAGLLWGGETLVLAVDRGDLWDLRATPAAGAEAPYPTKLPATRVVFDLDGNTTRSFQLDIVDAVATVELDQGRATAFVAADDKVAMLRFEGIAPMPRIVRPPALDALGYGPSRSGSDESSIWWIQDATGGAQWAVVVGWHDARDAREIAIAVATRGDGLEPLVVARERVADALADGERTVYLRHRVWWHDFWASSRVSLPDPLQATYDQAKYLAAASTRRGSPPLTPQGPWTGDNQALPPHRGAYRMDGATPLMQHAAHTAGLRDLDESYLRWHWQQLSRYREFARALAEVHGATVPGTLALDGRPAGETTAANYGAWVAHAFYLHWRYSRDEEFLRDRAYPFCNAIAEALIDQSSSSTDDNAARALRLRLFASLYQMARARADEVGAARWRVAFEGAAQLDTGSDGALTVAPGVPYDTTRGDFRAALAIYPLGIVDAQQPRDKPLIDATLERMLAAETDDWAGTKHAWMACLLARDGRGTEALAQLRAFRDGHSSRNGMESIDGDQQRTVTGNLLAMQAVHEMLLQSHGNAIVVFPAVPDEWSDVSFHNLNAEGGYWISGRRANGKTREVSVTARQKGVVRLADPFADRLVFWTSAVRTGDGVCEIPLEKGQKVTGSLIY